MTKLTRRRFGKGVVAAALGLPLVAKAASADSGLRIASMSELAVGIGVAFTYPNPHAAILVRLAGPAEHGVGPEQDIVAYHVACPHMGCPLVSLDAEALGRGEFGPCVCHESTFDLAHHGRQIYGRASQDLVRVVLEVRGDDVYAVGIVGLPFGEAVRLPL